MFLSFGKTIARFGGFRLGVGVRVGKKNAFLVCLLVMAVSMFKLLWYMLLLCGWMMYAVFYGMYWCIKKTVRSIAKKENGNTI